MIQIHNDDTEESETFKRFHSDEKIENWKKTSGFESEPLRRSYLRRMQVETDKHHLEKWLKILNTKDDEAEVLIALDELEFLVHQFDNANNFMKDGGIKAIFPLISHKNPSISSAALSVLNAAMQGNPAIQSYMEDFNLCHHFNEAVKNKSVHLSKFVSLISAYMRNLPSHQFEFLYFGGVKRLTSILKDHHVALSCKYKVIDFLGDLASEIFYDSGDETDDSKEALQIIFSFFMNKTRICDEIPSFLQNNNYTFQEKVVIAMNALYDVCYDSFRKNYVIQILLNVKQFYIKEKGNLIDQELKDALMNQLDGLMLKILRKVKKDEL